MIKDARVVDVSPGLFYRPADGWVGDVIPFYDDGTFWLFYLHERRLGPPGQSGASWHALRTRDLVAYEDLGEVLPHGDPGQQDFNAYTGSVVRGDGDYHLFYTGHNPDIRRDGRAVQAVMHAVSDNLLTWKKIPEDTFYADEQRYELHDWRDPHVFMFPETGKYGMLLAARERSGPTRRRGCIALCTSAELHHWTVEDPFWAPGLYITHECPDLLRLGDWWYLVYSEFSEQFTTRYRMARNLDGPWLVPDVDTLDGRAFYAAKTASDGQRAFAFGWVPTRRGEVDDGEWEWAGNLAIHELVQRADGQLDVRLPDFIASSTRRRVEPDVEPVVGSWVRTSDRHSVDAAGTYASAKAGDLPLTCLLTATVSFREDARAAGLLLRTGTDLDTAYIVRLEPRSNRIVFDRWPRRDPGTEQWHIAGDVPHAVELERPVDLQSGVPHRLQVLVSGTAGTAYVDGRVAMSFRMYDRRDGGWGLFAQEGHATFSDIAVHTW